MKKLKTLFSLFILLATSLVIFACSPPYRKVTLKSERLSFEGGGISSDIREKMFFEKGTVTIKVNIKDNEDFVKLIIDDIEIFELKEDNTYEFKVRKDHNVDVVLENIGYYRKLGISKPSEKDWKTKGYKQGDFGNIPKLNEEGYGVMTPNLKNSREFPIWDGLKHKNPSGKKEMLTVAYYETNDHNPLNALNYEIGDTGVPVIDIVVLFAFNFVLKDGTTKMPTIMFNENNKTIIDNYEKIIKPLQEKGIKVIADLMPHHSGIGYKNLDDEMRRALLDEIAELIDRFNLDGIDIDEEWAAYGKNDIPTNVTNSMRSFCIDYRKRFPNKLLTVFNYNLSSDMLGVPIKIDHPSLEEKTKVIDYTFNNYGAIGKPDFVESTKYVSISIECNQYPNRAQVEYYADYALKNGYGVLMFFNLQVHFSSHQMSGYTRKIWDEDCKYVGKHYPHWSKGYHECDLDN